MSSKDAEQEVTQIHLAPKSLRDKVRLRAELLAKYAAEGQDPSTVSPLVANFDYFSGRGVRYRVLDPDERDVILGISAKLVGPDATMPELSARIATESVKKMLVSVTRKRDLTTLEGLTSGDWVPLNDAMLAGMPGSEQWRFEKLFTSKDVGVLRTIYRRLHEVTEADMDEIEGKATPVILE